MQQEEIGLQPDRPPAEIPTKLLNKNFLLLWQGQFISQMGNQVHAVAMMFWIKHATGSATLMGTLLMLASLPGVLLGPLGGTFADRHSRRKIIIFSDLFAGVAVLSLAILLSYLPNRTELIIIWLSSVSVILSVITAAFGPAIGASIPDLVPRDKIAAANSWRQSSYQLSSFFGQGAGGVLFRVLGAPVLFLFDGLSYLLSAACCLFVNIPQTFPEKATGFREVIRAFKSDTIEGMHYVWKRKGMRDLFFSATLLNFCLSPFATLLPFYVEDNLKATSDWFGYMLATLGVGALFGYLFAGSVKPSGRGRTIIFVSCMIGISVTFIAFGINTITYVAMLLMFIFGFLSGTVNIYVATILQSTTPSEIRGRVFGLLGAISGGLMPIGMGLAGVIADLTGKNIPLIFSICGIISLFVTIFLATLRDFREFVAFEPGKDDQSGSTIAPDSV